MIIVVVVMERAHVGWAAVSVSRYSRRWCPPQSAQGQDRHGAQGSHSTHGSQGPYLQAPCSLTDEHAQKGSRADG